MKMHLLCSIFLFCGCIHAAERTIVVNWDYYPQIQKIADEYNAMPGIQDKAVLKIETSMPRWFNPNGYSGRSDIPSDAAFIAGDIMVSDKKMEGFHKTPIWYEQFLLFANKNNPFLKQLGKNNLTLEQFRRIWAGSITWEELAGLGEGKSKVNAWSMEKVLLAKLLKTEKFTFRDSGYSSMTMKQVELDRFGLGGALIGNEESTRFLTKEFTPLAWKKTENGKYRLIPVFDQPQQKAFGKVLESGDFIQSGFYILSKTPDDPFARKFAEAASNLGEEAIRKLGYFPVVRKKKVPRRLPKFVFAHAMQCFLFGIPVMNHGNKNSTEDFANWPQKDDAYRAWWSEKYYPLSRTKSVEASKADLDMAQEAGLDALGLLVGPQQLTPGYYAYDAIVNLLKAAQTHKVKIIPDVWDFFRSGADQEERSLVLNYQAEKITSLMRQYPDAFYKQGGKYVVCMGQPVRRGKYQEIEPFFNLFGGRDSVLLIAGMVDLPEQNRSQGWVDGADQLTAFEVHTGWGDRVLDHILVEEAKRGKKLCWPVSTGMHTNTGNVNRSFSAEGLGACKMIDQWRNAIKYPSESVYIASWNDFSEDHQINHSNYRGDSFMRLTKYFADYFRTGKAPEITEERLFLFHHRQLVDAVITEGKYRGKYADWQSTPPTDYVHVISMLKKAGTLELELGGKNRCLENVPAGFHEWLVYVPRTKKHAQTHWNAGSYERNYPGKDANRDVTEIESIPPCRPVLNLIRNGETVCTLSARTEIAGKARFADLCTVGISSPVNKR